MIVKLEHSGINMEITYDDDGFFEHVKNVDIDKYMMIETKQEGLGYTIKEDNFMVKMDVCDARYVRIMDIDVFIPRLLFITNKK